MLQPDLDTYRHGQSIPDSHSTMRVWIGLPMSVENLLEMGLSLVCVNVLQ